MQRAESNDWHTSPYPVSTNCNNNDNMQPTVIVPISFNPHSGPYLQFLPPQPPFLGLGLGASPFGKGSQDSPQRLQSRPHSSSLSPIPRPGRNRSAATWGQQHTAQPLRAVHYGVRSFPFRLRGRSSLARELHFPEDGATPSASPCSNLEAEVSPTQRGVGNYGVWGLSLRPEVRVLRKRGACRPRASG